MRFFTALKISFRNKATLVRFANSEVAELNANVAFEVWPVDFVRGVDVVHSSLLCLERRNAASSGQPQASGGAQNTEEEETANAEA
jgi:hypothetical protein